MKKEVPLVNRKFLLEKYPGKGGWTYAAIPEILQNKNNPFGCTLCNDKVRQAFPNLNLGMGL